MQRCQKCRPTDDPIPPLVPVETPVHGEDPWHGVAADDQRGQWLNPPGVIGLALELKSTAGAHYHVAFRTVSGALSCLERGGHRQGPRPRCSYGRHRTVNLPSPSPLSYRGDLHLKRVGVGGEHVLDSVAHS